ncbi:MAG: hypothetical protein ACAI38_01850, partial [Myxococcota bacterium]
KRVRVNPALADVPPGTVTAQLSYDADERPRGVSGCDSPNKCGAPSQPRFEVAMAPDGDPYANFQVVMRDADSGEERRVLASGEPDREGVVHLQLADWMDGARGCIMLAGVGWGGAVGPALDLGCIRRQ